MALCQLPNIVTSTSSKVYFSPLFFSNRENHLQGLKYHHLHAATSCKRLAFVCSAKKPRISKRVKLPRTNMSDDDLCNEIRDFVSKEGLPGNYIPSIAELSRRGRKDLADIVKRKGYRMVAGLLMNQINENTHSEKKLDVNQDSLICVLESTDLQETSVTDVSAEDNLPRCVSSVENYIHSKNGFVAVETQNQSSESSEYMLGISQESAKKLIQNEKSILEHLPTHVTVDECQRSSHENQMSELNLNYRNLSPDTMAEGLRSHQEATSFSSKENIPRDNDSDEMLPSPTFDADVISEAVDFKKDYEINHLKTMLSQKETELLLLKNEIEKEKLALPTLRDKTNAEISNIQNLILAKDAELRAAEEGLLGLKEVHIEYQAHGDAVEVTGSFNGWHHRLKMERYSSPINQASSKLRESNYWAVTLWLYPGVYEIKFVVDGHWMIDSQREIISRGHTTNNILRVEG